MMKNLFHPVLAALWLAPFAFALGAETPLSERLSVIDETIAKGTYKPDWDSLKAHQDPEWFRDAKIGIYTHWGPVTVGVEDGPGEGQWYGNAMYRTDNPTFDYHRKKFGDQKEVGFKDLIPKFTADKFDADAWADLFVQAGAKFAGPVAVHHDNFAMWDSKLTRWNSMNMGPHRDVTGELEKAIRARGLKFITTFHHGFAWRYFQPAFKYDGADPQYADLYTEPHSGKTPPSKLFQDRWLAMVDEVLVKYQPDLIWFDFELDAVIKPDYQKKMFAMTYDWAAQNGREIGVAHKFRSIQRYTGILDFERGREDRLVPYPWLTDTSVGPWFNQNSAKFKTVDELVDVLVDIVSKNGCLLLNVGPKSDGTIPDQARQILLGMGAWLKLNGEAIYGTRPWVIFGEGPTQQAGGAGFSENSDRPFTAEDIRFTTRGNVLYAIGLKWPESGRLQIKSLAKAAGDINNLSLIGSADAVKWTQTANGLEVTLPTVHASPGAFVLRIADGVNLKPMVSAPTTTTIGVPPWDRTVPLLPADARLNGESLRVEKADSGSYITGWTNTGAGISWKVNVRKQTTYQVNVQCSSPTGPADFVVEVAGETFHGTAPKTSSATDFVTVSVGRVDVPADKSFELQIHPASEDTWHPVNLEAILLHDVN